MTRIQIGQTRLLAHVLLAAATIGTTCFAKDGGGPTASQRADAGTDLHRMFFDPVRPTPGERHSTPAPSSARVQREPLTLDDPNALQLMPTQTPPPPFAPTRPHMRRFDECNLTVDVPGNPWAERDPKLVSGETLLHVVRTDPFIVVLLGCEAKGVEQKLDNRSLVSLSQVRLRAVASDATITPTEAASAHGIDGLRYTSTRTMAGHGVYCVHWVAMSNGYAYSLVAVGARADSALVDDAHRDFLNRLKRIDATKIAHAEGEKFVNRFDSAAFGYQVDVKNMGWAAAPESDANLIGADFSAKHGLCELIVIPIPMPHRTPDLEVLSKSMLARLAFDYPTCAVKTRPCRLDSLSGQEIDAERVIGSLKIHYRLHVVADDRCGYVIATSVVGDDPSGDAAIGDALGKITITSRDLPDAPKLSMGQQRTCGLVLNDLGLAAHQHGEDQTAIDYLAAAYRCDPQSKNILSNYVEVLAVAGHSHEAQTLLDNELAGGAGSLRLKSIQVKLRIAQGDYEGARKYCQKMIREGCSDEGIVAEYVALAIKCKTWDEALATIDAFADRRPTVRVQRWHAVLLSYQGDVEKSVEMLQKLHEEHPVDTGIAIDLASVFERAEKYDQAIQITQGLLDAGNKEEDTLLCHGRIQLLLKQFAEAKKTFERAASLYPNSEDARACVVIASNQLGEGENSSLRAPIEPVATPSVVLASISQPPTRPPEDLEKYGAEELTRTVGISFHVGQPLRRTSFRRVKVYTQSGVAEYTNLTFPFEPSTERFYVNRLVVFDAEGKQVAKGSVDSYYVMDDSSSGVASRHKVVNVPVPGLKPGYSLEIETTREDYAPAKEFPFEAITLASTVPVGASALFVEGDVARLKSVTSLPMEIGSSENLMHCVQVNPTPYRYESKQQQPERFLPIVWIGESGASWEGVAQDYLKVAEDRLVVDDAVRLHAIELTQHCQTNREKLAAIAADVQQSYTYQAIEFGRRSPIPNQAGKTLQLKYGDCKDHAVLLKGMLDAAGVPAYLTLVNATGALAPNLPSLDQFNHMVVFVPGSSLKDDDNAVGGLVVDCTNKYADPLLFPPSELTGKQVLVLDPGRPRLVEIPPLPTDAGKLKTERTITIRADGARGDALVADVHEELTFGPYLAPKVRGYLKLCDAGARRKAIQDLLSHGDPICVKRVEAANLDKTSEPLTMQIDYTLPDTFHRVGAADQEKTLVARLPSPWENRLLGADYLDDRQTPFEIELPLLITTSLEIKLPPGYQLADLEQWNTSGQNLYAGWKANAQQEGDVVTARFRLRLVAGRHPAEDYPQYYGAMKDSLAFFETPVTLLQSGTKTADRRSAAGNNTVTR